MDFHLIYIIPMFDGALFTLRILPHPLTNTVQQSLCSEKTKSETSVFHGVALRLEKRRKSGGAKDAATFCRQSYF